MRKPKLIPDWREAWKFSTVRLSMIGLAWAALPEAKQTAILAWAGIAPADTPAVLAGLYILFRVLDMGAQPPAPPSVERQPWAGPPRD